MKENEPVYKWQAPDDIDIESFKLCYPSKVKKLSQEMQDAFIISLLEKYLGRDYQESDFSHIKLVMKDGEDTIHLTYDNKFVAELRYEMTMTGYNLTATMNNPD